MWVAQEGGCDKCGESGYGGRVGIYEAILLDKKIEELLDELPSDKEITEAAVPQGILTMKEDGIVKILEGLTSLDELGRVLDLDSDL